MATPIVLPELGAGDDEVRIGCWLVEQGESINAGDRIVELVLPGTTFDVASPASGVLARIDKSSDAAAAPGDVLGWIETLDDVPQRRYNGSPPAC